MGIFIDTIPQFSTTLHVINLFPVDVKRYMHPKESNIHNPCQPLQSFNFLINLKFLTVMLIPFQTLVQNMYSFKTNVLAPIGDQCIVKMTFLSMFPFYWYLHKWKGVTSVVLQACIMIRGAVSLATLHWWFFKF